MKGPEISIENLNLSLGGTEVLKDISLQIHSGDVHCLIGPNGGGKTSLARCLLGQMPHGGSISIAWGENRTIGYVPQHLQFDRTLPITVSDFMALICQKRRPAFVGLSKANRDIAEEALHKVGFVGKRKRPLGSLSGGERQRVLFAQALIPAPSLLVLDEPMTSLDQHGAELFGELIGKVSSGGVTILWISHELALAKKMATTVSCVNQSLLFSGPTEDVMQDLRPDVLFSQIHPDEAPR